MFRFRNALWLFSLMMVCGCSHLHGPSNAENDVERDPAGAHAKKSQNGAQAITPQLLDSKIGAGLNYLRANQASDGGWHRLVLTSSPVYSCQAVLFYEYMSMLDGKKDIATKLMRDAWTYQKSDGTFSMYEGGAASDTLMVLMYVAAKTVGEPEDSPRMRALETAINFRHSTENVGGMGLPFLAALGLKEFNLPTGSFNGAMAFQLTAGSWLPWIKVIGYPFLYLIKTGSYHRLSDNKIPLRIGLSPVVSFGHYSAALGHLEFFHWMKSRMGTDGSFFDSAPTTMLALMALANDKQSTENAAIIKKGVAAIESYQLAANDGALHETPGYVDVGETAAILYALEEVGVNQQDSLITKSEQFLYSVQQKESGAFGSAKSNLWFPDADDTGTSLYVLGKLATARTGGDPTHQLALNRSIKWLLKMQNPDGGWGTWDKEAPSFFSKRLEAKLPGALLASSIVEHTSRIIGALALYKTQSSKVNSAYQKALSWLQSQQTPDGSFPATWYVAQTFGTAMALSALGTAAGDASIDKNIDQAISYIVGHQYFDGSFSESPDSFVYGKTVKLAQGSPAQTGLIVSLLMAYLNNASCKHADLLKPVIESAIKFILQSQNADGLWHDPAWTGVVFPGVEYLIYGIFQETAPFYALGSYKQQLTQGCFK